MFEETKITLKEFKEEFEIYKNSITICKIADKETSERLRINPGDEYTTIRQPQTKEEAFERLKKYDAMKLFFAFVENFNDKYSLNLKTLKDELDTINQFIENAEKIKIDEAINIYNKNFNPSKSYENEYIKLKYGHYENKNYSSYYAFFDNTSFFIKAKYFLYKDWLENEIKNIENDNQITSTKPEETKRSETENKITIQPHDDIFSNNGFQLFEYILNENFIKPKNKRGRYNDLSYFYWRMFNNDPKYIHQRPEPFRNWFNSKYSEEFTKILTIERVKRFQRDRDFSTALDWFKLQSR